jgi:hypothetical protein
MQGMQCPQLGTKTSTTLITGFQIADTLTHLHHLRGSLMTERHRYGSWAHATDHREIRVTKTCCDHLYQNLTRPRRVKIDFFYLERFALSKGRRVLHRMQNSCAGFHVSLREILKI